MFLKLTFVSLPLEHAMFFKTFSKTQPVSLYWFTWQKQTITFKREKFDSFCRKFSSILSELSFNFQNKLEVPKKWLKLKHDTKPHISGTLGLRANGHVKNPQAVTKDGPLIIF